VSAPVADARGKLGPSMASSKLSPAATPRFSRRERALLALGLVAWIGIIAAGAWLVRQLARPPAPCGQALDGRTQPGGDPAAGPRGALRRLAGNGRCPA